MCTLFCMNICLWGSFCQSGCRVCSRWIKNDNVSLIPSAVWSCFNEINRIFCVGMWQCTKPGCITTLRSQSGRQPSGLQSVRSVQSGQKRKCGPVRLWPQYFEKLNELSFELLPHPPYSPDLDPRDYYLFADLKKMLQGKRFYSNEEVITGTNAYFEAKDKSFYKKGIEMLEKRCTDCVAFEGLLN